MFNPSWSTITKKYCDMSKADVVLSQKDNKLLVTGMAKYPNESLMHPRALAERLALRRLGDRLRRILA